MAIEATIRDAAFAKRLAQACDASPHCPDMNRGRLTWIVDQFKVHGAAKLTVQSVARWMNGESKPREGKNILLAKMLGVDPVWLYMGVDSAQAKRKPSNDPAKALADAASALLEVHDAMGQGQSHTATKLRDAIAEYRRAA